MGNLTTELSRSLRSLAPQARKAVKLLKKNVTFFAVVVGDASVDPNTFLGSDIREQVSLRCLRSEVPAELLAGDAECNISVSIDGVHHTINRREDSVANPIVKFTATKVV